MPFGNQLPGKVYTCATTPGGTDTGGRVSAAGIGTPHSAETGAMLPCRTKLRLILPSGSVNRPERRTQADFLVFISLHLEQRKAVIGVEHDIRRESSCKGSGQAEEE